MMSGRGTIEGVKLKRRSERQVNIREETIGRVELARVERAGYKY